MQKLLFTIILLMCLLPACPVHVAADVLPDYQIANGHFYSQASGIAGAGYTITDEGGIGFWSSFKSLGGVPDLGYPISRRFMCGGFVCQAMQKAVLQWQPATQRVAFLNTLDLLAQSGKDAWLQAYRQVPTSADWAADHTPGQTWNQIVERHLALLNQNPSLKARYGTAIDLYGLPLAYSDMGNVYVLRMQRAVFQQWKTDVPWAKAGEVTIANSGAVALEAGLIPAAASTPISVLEVGPPWQPPAAKPVRIRIPAIGVNAGMETVGLEPDGSIGVPQDPYKVAWWNNGVYPGMRGNSVIVGHVDSAIVGPAVFWYLYKLAPGNEVIVDDAEGHSHVFVVTEVARYAWNDTSPIPRYSGPTDQTQLNLITCTGKFDRQTHNYLERLIVYTHLKE